MMFLPLATSGSLVPVHNFWNTILLYNNRPNLVNNRLVGAKALYFYRVGFHSKAVAHIYELLSHAAILYEIRKAGAKLCKENLSRLVVNLLEAYDKNVALSEINLEEFSSCCDGVFICVKLLLPKLKHYETCVEIVALDKNNNVATFIAVGASDKQVLAPPFQYHIELMQSGHMRIVVQNFEDAETSSAEWLADKLFVKLMKWSEHCNSPPSAQPESLVSIDQYSELYRNLKKKYGSQMVKMWPENTDPLKFVYEDIAIATYLICLWDHLTPNYKPNFVDLGCGNGLLVHILHEEGYEGVGIDVRKRKIWDLYPRTVQLRVSTIVPSSSFLFPDADWIIGNHSDELTPWVPVIAARSSQKTNFFLLPCCFYDFDGSKYNRINTGNSQYSDYMQYVQNICDVCGFLTRQDKLRIPSTKKICIVSTSRRYEREDFKDVNAKIADFIRKRTPSSAGTNEDSWSSSFSPRAGKETVRNCTKLDRDLLHKIVRDVVSELLKGENYLRKNGGLGGVGGVWNAGRSLTFEAIVGSLDPADLKQLKKECGGLQTLMRNHRYVFELEDGLVKIRVPADLQSVRKYKDKPCWFSRNHPDGCLHDSDRCAFSH